MCINVCFFLLVLVLGRGGLSLEGAVGNPLGIMHRPSGILLGQTDSFCKKEGVNYSTFNFLVLNFPKDLSYEPSGQLLN